MGQHSKEKRERYARGLRYSDEAARRKRQNNCRNWHSRAVQKYGRAFDYELALTQFQTQKEPKVTITCNVHNHSFLVTPDKHLQNKFGGCDILFYLKSESYLLARLTTPSRLNIILRLTSLARVFLKEVTPTKKSGV